MSNGLEEVTAPLSEIFTTSQWTAYMSLRTCSDVEIFEVLKAIERERDSLDFDFQTEDEK